MSEIGPQVEYVGLGKPDVGTPGGVLPDMPKPVEQKKTEHPAVGAVKKTITAWWERVGPEGVEKSWVNAHKNILKHIDGEERQKAFEKTAGTWRNIGKIVGWTSTVIDFGVSGFGLVLGISGWRNPKGAVDTTTSLLTWISGRDGDTVRKFTGFFDVPESVKNKGEDAINAYKKQRDTLGGRVVSTIPGIAGGGMLFTGGLSHFGAGLTAKVVELFGVVGAHGSNYVASGNAGEHAKIVGKIVEKSAQYALEHPEEIRKTVRTVEQIRRDRIHDQEMKEMRRKQEAEARLQREYNMWMNAMDPGERSWYEQNHQWPPPMAKFLQERESFMRELRKKEEMAREKIQ